MKTERNFLSQFAKNKALAALLILVNLAGVAFGLYYYSGQLLDTPRHLWAFVPDSPTAVMLFASFLFLYTFKKYQHPALNLLTALYLVKTGLWSVFVLFLFWPSYFVLNAAFSATLILLHLGMVLEAFVIASVWKGRVRAKHAALVMGWFLLGDFMDYVMGTVPYPIPFIGGSYLNALAAESVLATITISLCFYRKFGDRRTLHLFSPEAQKSNKRLL
ncbi:MAG: DUF1405 domain-containing protein [Candidatus Aenigmarchaeota archaeon]|nr:DUF1405 domain-containing protein [Candidatus Aenigmarchaeota archaeon]